MEAETVLGVETAKNIYTYPMIGFDMFITYDKDKNIVNCFCSETGILINALELSWASRNMSFKEFVQYAKRLYIHNLKNTSRFN